MWFLKSVVLIFDPMRNWPWNWPNDLKTFFSYQQTLVLVKMYWKRLDDVSRVTIFGLLRCLEDALEGQILLDFVMTKTGNRFMVLLDFGYNLQHCSAKGSWYTLHKKWSFLLKIFPVHTTKFASSCVFGHIYWRNP